MPMPADVCWEDQRVVDYLIARGAMDELLRWLEWRNGQPRGSISYPSQAYKNCKVNIIFEIPF